MNICIKYIYYFMYHTFIALDFSKVNNFLNSLEYKEVDTCSINSPYLFSFVIPPHGVLLPINQVCSNRRGRLYYSLTTY